jgi:hypothetical protein
MKNKKILIVFGALALASFGFYLYTKSRNQKKLVEMRNQEYEIVFNP